MGRNKVKHELICNRTSRKATFKKRKVGLLKKLSELTTLCGVVACAVIYNVYDPQVESWPSPREALDVLESFRNLPTKKQDKYMMDQKTFLNKQISRLKEQLEKERAKSRGLEQELFLIHHLEGKDLCNFNCLGKLIQLGSILDEKIEFVTKRIEFINNLRPARIVTSNDTNTVI